MLVFQKHLTLKQLLVKPTTILKLLSRNLLISSGVSTSQQHSLQLHLHLMDFGELLLQTDSTTYYVLLLVLLIILLDAQQLVLRTTQLTTTDLQVV